MNVVFGENFKITSIAILERKNDLYVQMLHYRIGKIDENGKNIYRDFCNPIKQEFREELYGNILKKYENAEFDEMYVEYNQGEALGKLDYEIKTITFEKEPVKSQVILKKLIRKLKVSQ